jgi:hypothetical protein
MTYRLRISIEMKDRTITGPLLNEIVGLTLRDDPQVKDIVIVCRNVNDGARADKQKHERQHKVRITFIVDQTTP